MKKANIIYWYGLPEMPRDGGGLRALAWYEALNALGYEASIHALRSLDVGVSPRSTLRNVKKSLIPMPLNGKLPNLPDAELNVITVPSVFQSASRTIPKKKLIFDWMDLWSVNSRTMAQSSPFMRPGGYLQSVLWHLLERKLPGKAAGNAFAGHEDYISLTKPESYNSEWMPTPVEWPRSLPVRTPGPIRRIGFLGNMNYPPNMMSLRKFLSEQGPQLESLGFELIIAGYGSETVNTWGTKSIVLGPVENVGAFYSQVDAVVVPIHHGGGIKVKAVEAMAYGVPVFGTEHVRSGFDRSLHRYVGDIDDLLSGSASEVPVPSVDVVRNNFSQLRFQQRVEGLLLRSGF